MDRIVSIIIFLCIVFFGYKTFNKYFPGFFDSELENKIMCARVASQMGDYNAEKIATKKTIDYLQKENINLSQKKLMMIGEHVDNDILELYKLNSYGKDVRIADVYDSWVCQKLYND